MNSYFDIYGKRKGEKGFFIGANTPGGFDYSASDEFSEESFLRLYILKGGPGSGKSTLMKRAADEFPDRCRRFFCSSDPDSLDGVIIETGKGKIGITDGTAPHNLDPMYPGACGITVDLGESFDIGALSAEKEKIAALSSAKKEHFRRAYKYLGAAEKIMRARERMSEKAYLRKKAESAARRIAGEKSGKAKGKCSVLRTLSLSCKGAVRVSGFDGAKHKILLADCFCMLSDFTKTLADSLLDAGENIAVSVSPLGEIGEIYIPGWDMLISPFAQGRIEKTVNLRRFFDSGAVNDVRGKLNFTGKCFNMAVMSALEELECAGKAHAVLEKIYTPAVDFNKVDSIGCRIIEEIVEAVK